MPLGLLRPVLGVLILCLPELRVLVALCVAAALWYFRVVTKNTYMYVRHEAPARQQNSFCSPIFLTCIVANKEPLPALIHDTTTILVRQL